MFQVCVYIIFLSVLWTLGYPHSVTMGNSKMNGQPKGGEGEQGHDNNKGGSEADGTSVMCGHLENTFLGE